MARLDPGGRGALLGAGDLDLLRVWHRRLSARLPVLHTRLGGACLPYALAPRLWLGEFLGRLTGPQQLDVTPYSCVCGAPCFSGLTHY